jgi:hypothetical protein
MIVLIDRFGPQFGFRPNCIRQAAECCRLAACAPQHPVSLHRKRLTMREGKVNLSPAVGAPSAQSVVMQ